MRGGAARLITVVLDEIAALPASLQQSIANVLKRRTVTLDGITLGGIRLIAVTRTFEGDTEGLTWRLEVLPLRRTAGRYSSVGAERFSPAEGGGGWQGRTHADFPRLHSAAASPLAGERAGAAECCGAGGGDLHVGREGGPCGPGSSGGFDGAVAGGYPSLKELERIYIERVVRESPTLKDAASGCWRWILRRCGGSVGRLRVMTPALRLSEGVGVCGCGRFFSRKSQEGNPKKRSGWFDRSRRVALISGTH